MDHSPGTNEPATGKGAGSPSKGLQGSISKPHDSEPKRTRQAVWRVQNPEKSRAHLAVASAVRRGDLARPDVCDCCGKPGRLDAHHEDHSQPLKVRWLLRSCHVREHERLRRKAGADG